VSAIFQKCRPAHGVCRLLFPKRPARPHFTTKLSNISGPSRAGVPARERRPGYFTCTHFLLSQSIPCHQYFSRFLKASFCSRGRESLARRTSHWQYTMPPKTPVPLASNRSAESTAHSAAPEPGLSSVDASLVRYLRGSGVFGEPRFHVWMVSLAKDGGPRSPAPAASCSEPSTANTASATATPPPSKPPEPPPPK
jgi:hypothetical protein